MSDYKWTPLTPLSAFERSLAQDAMPPLYEAWRASKQRLRESASHHLDEFNKRLVRSLSIETGILEQLYDLDRGTTEALVVHGFAEDLLTHSSSNIEPAHLMDILRDQEAAITLTMDCVAQKRSLTRGLMHELHSILTSHQDTTTAIDQFGNRMQIPLLKGKFKEQANNPKRPDESLHEYCPPVHVESEIDRLIELLSQYDQEDPILVATWLHHRFTQIHPYQDGNGRMARALTTMVLLRADLLPLVVDRDLRVDYIQGLEHADKGDLSRLVAIFGRLERSAILNALSVDVSAELGRQKTLTTAVIGSLSAKFNKRRAAKFEELRVVNKVARIFRERATVIVGDAFSQLRQALDQIGQTRSNVEIGGTDKGNGHWYRFELVHSATKAGKFANLAEDHYFVKASARVGTERLVFVVSFHHIGRELTGIMEATAFSMLESFEESDERQSVSEDPLVTSIEPFVFAYSTDAEQSASAFTKWLDAAAAIAIKEYGDRL